MWLIDSSEALIDQFLQRWQPPSLPAPDHREGGQAWRLRRRHSKEASGPPLRAPMDERRITQVCINWLSNALKFISEGGTINAPVEKGRICD